MICKGKFKYNGWRCPERRSAFMILYLVAKKMEQRARLKQSIRENGGDINTMLVEKAEIEQLMLSKASEWINIG